MAYRADIEIAVKGATQLTNLQKQLEATAASVNAVNSKLSSQGVFANSLSNLQKTISQSTQTMRSAAAGTTAQKQAIDVYVKSLAAAEKAETQLAAAIKRRQQELGLATKTTAQASGAGAGKKISGSISGGIIGGAFPLLFGQGAGAAVGGAIGGVLGGLAGPGGSFAGSLLGTLIGDMASKGQQIKQLSEDIGFSAQQTDKLAAAFKIANTDVEKFTAVIQNIRGVGLELDQQATAIQLVTTLTQKYGGEFTKVGNAITTALESGKVTQGVLNQLTSQGIDIQGALADKYGVNRDKILEMAKKGKISVQDLADTLVDLGNKAETAADKTQTPLQKAFGKTKQLFESYFEDIKAIFTGVGGEGSKAATTLLNAFNSLLEKVIFPFSRAVARIISLFIQVAAVGVRVGSALFSAFKGVAGAIRDAVVQVVRMIPGLSTIVGLASKLLGKAFGPVKGAAAPPTQEKIDYIDVPNQAAPSGGGAGAKPPESKVASLQEELTALKAITIAEDRIRDLQFQGRELAVLEAERTKVRADIERDRVKALLSANYADEKAIINQIALQRLEQLRLELADKEREIKQKRFEEELQVADAIRQSVEPFKQLRDEQEAQTKFANTYHRLVMEGVLPAEAERIANFEKLVAQQLQIKEEQIRITEAAIAAAEAEGLRTVELEKQLKILKGQESAIQAAAVAGPGKGETDAERLQKTVSTLKSDLNGLTNPINAAITGAMNIGSAFQQAFTSIATGATTTQEALANFFKSVGEAFVSMAAEIIAKQLVMITLQTILKALGVAGGGGGAESDAAFMDRVGRLDLAGDVKVPKLASGGYVTGPTRAIVGEGGESEYIIPASKMAGAMARYSAGARGSNVIPDSSAPSAGGPGGSNTFTLETVVINNVEYATVEQVRELSARAARDGAEGGYNRSMGALRNSRSQRNRIGLR